MRPDGENRTFIFALQVVIWLSAIEVSFNNPREIVMKRTLKIGGGVLCVLVLGLVGFIGVKIGTASWSYPDTPYPKIQASTDPRSLSGGPMERGRVREAHACGTSRHRVADAMRSLPRDDRGGPAERLPLSEDARTTKNEIVTHREG